MYCKVIGKYNHSSAFWLDLAGWSPPLIVDNLMYFIGFVLGDRGSCFWICDKNAKIFLAGYPWTCQQGGAVAVGAEEVRNHFLNIRVPSYKS